MDPTQLLAGKAAQDWIQGGSFGLLAIIAGWLMYWVPRWIKAVLDAREKEDANRVKMTTDYHGAVEAIVKAFHEEGDKERQACERRHAALLDRMDAHHERQLDDHKETRHAVRGLAQAASIRAAVEAAEEEAEERAAPAKH